jgi:hypothetical protein
MSGHLRNLVGLSSAFVLTGALAGCATYAKCGIEGCAGDAKVTANVQALLDRHPELGPPGRNRGSDTRSCGVSGRLRQYRVRA